MKQISIKYIQVKSSSTGTMLEETYNQDWVQNCAKITRRVKSKVVIYVAELMICKTQMVSECYLGLNFSNVKLDISLIPNALVLATFMLAYAST